MINTQGGHMFGIRCTQKKQDAGYLIELKMATDTQGTSMQFVCLSGEP